ncbi:hypothetical protein VTL71DRAFT_8286 [Oculimacula yallundae]|uniref:NADP-dependent oxidoreductase domain-containing protein n=1 Tax=Oculimacula yallundae TaxID=86028 RepID=A0ABR4CX63_9HELO
MAHYIPNILLNDGNHIPAFGIGFHHSVTTVSDQISVALQLGIRHIQVTSLDLLEAIRLAIEQSAMSWTYIFISAKVGRGADLRQEVEDILLQLKRPYLDMCLLDSRWPGTQDRLINAWTVMEDIKARGLARSIGVSNNWSKEQLEIIFAEARHYLPAINEQEFHPFCNQEDYLQWTKCCGIVTCSFRLLEQFIQESKKYPAFTTNILTPRSVLRWIQLSGVITFELVEQLKMYETSQTHNQYQAIKALATLRPRLEGHGASRALKEEKLVAEMGEREACRAVEKERSVIR